MGGTVCGEKSASEGEAEVASQAELLAQAQKSIWAVEAASPGADSAWLQELAHTLSAASRANGRGQLYGAHTLETLGYSHVDADRCAMLNSVLNVWWPHLSTYLLSLLLGLNDQIGELGFGAHLDTSTCSLGSSPPRFKGVEVEETALSTSSGKLENLKLRCDLEWQCTGVVELCIMGKKLGLENVEFRASLFVELVKMSSAPPFFDGVRFFFRKAPEISLKGTKFISVLEKVPNLKKKLLGIVTSSIAGILLPPNMIGVAFTEIPDIFRVKHPRPQGVLEIRVVKADGLIAMDTNMWGKATSSDPYVVVTCGAQSFRSETQPKTLCPVFGGKDGWQVWLLVHRFKDALVKFELFDEDRYQDDDFLGSVEISVEDLLRKKAHTSIGPMALALEDLDGEAGSNGTLSFEAVWRPIVLDVARAHEESLFWVFAGVFFASDVPAGARSDTAKYWVAIRVSHLIDGWPDCRETSKRSLSAAPAAGPGRAAPAAAPAAPMGDVPDWLQDLAPSRPTMGKVTYTMSDQFTKCLIGRGGSTIRGIINRTGADIQVRSQPESDGVVSIVGNVGAAEAMMREVMASRGCFVPIHPGAAHEGAPGLAPAAPEGEAPLTIPSELVGLFIGNEGSGIKEIKAGVGGGVSIKVLAPLLEGGLQEVQVVGEQWQRAKEIARGRVEECKKTTPGRWNMPGWNATLIAGGAALKGKSAGKGKNQQPMQAGYKGGTML